MNRPVSMSATPSSEIKALTSLRMFAAFLVFVHHFYVFSGNGYLLENILHEGHIGVGIFFALSGFLLTQRYFREFSSGKITRRMLVDYFRKRVARIYPLYFFLIIVSGGLPTRLLGIIPFTLTQGFFADWNIYVIQPAWSLTVEESFYILLPIISAFFLIPSGRRNTVSGNILRLVLISVALLLIGGILGAISNATGLSRFGGFMADNIHIIINTIFGRFPDFAIGIVAALIYQRKPAALYTKPSGRILGEVFAVGGILGIAIVSNAIYLNGSIPRAWILNYGVSVATGFLMLGLARQDTWTSRVFSIPLFVYLGKVSYALYLIQGTPLLWSYKETGYLISTFSPLVSFCLLYIGVNILCALLYELIESPARRLILKATDPWVEKKPIPASP